MRSALTTLTLLAWVEKAKLRNVQSDAKASTGTKRTTHNNSRRERETSQQEVYCWATGKYGTAEPVVISARCRQWLLVSVVVVWVPSILC